MYLGESFVMTLLLEATFLKLMTEPVDQKSLWRESYKKVKLASAEKDSLIELLSDSSLNTIFKERSLIPFLYMYKENTQKYQN